SDVEPRGLLSASTNFSEVRMGEKGGLDHYIGVATTNKTPSNFTQLEVPALTWLVFDSVGIFLETLQDIWGRIYSEWFQSYNFESVIGTEILWNEIKHTNSTKFKSEIWLPAKKK